MKNFTTETYQIKREIINFSNKISDKMKRPEIKFTADMLYGIITSGNILLSEIARSLKEENKLINTIERLSKHLAAGRNLTLENNYCKQVAKMLPDEPVILVDDTDINKSKGKKFEALGRVRDASSENGDYVKGYINTELVGLTKNTKQPVSLFSYIHSSKAKNYSSTNTITYYAIDQAISTIGERKATFVMDRGYDANSMFNHIIGRDQYFITRVKSNRKFFYKSKWYGAETLSKSRKGKIKTIITFNEEGKELKKECYISHLNVQITAARLRVKLIIIYGISDTPMMLLTNRDISGKDDTIKVVRTYFSRWRIEEYFRFKKQHFDYENYRVRSLKSMNSLNQFLSFSITFMCMMGEKSKGNNIRQCIMKSAAALRDKVLFNFYRLAKGLKNILYNARSGIRGWYKPVRSNSYQLQMKLIC